jgi:predicted nucleotidyltransferase
MDDFLFATNSQKVLRFFLDANSELYDRVIIEKKTGLSKAGVNLALHELSSLGLIAKDIKAKVFIYKLEFGNIIVKQLKVMRTAAMLASLMNKIKPYAGKIILFGSASRGENLPDSDIDLFILTRQEEAVRRLVKSGKLKNKLQLIIKTPLEFSNLKKADPYFYEEINRGITVWEQI